MHWRIVIEGDCDPVYGMWHSPVDFLEYYQRDSKKFPPSYGLTVKLDVKRSAGKARSIAALSSYNYGRHLKTCQICSDIALEIGMNGSTQKRCEIGTNLRIWSEVFEREADRAHEIMVRNGS